MKNLLTKKEHFKYGFIQGLGWSFGVSVGFVLISILLVLLLQALGGLPLIGSWIASIVEATQKQLQLRTPIFN